MRPDRPPRPPRSSLAERAFELGAALVKRARAAGRNRGLSARARQLL